MKILYGVPSEGMGHATRSKVIIRHLLDCGHEVRIATSDRAYTFLENDFPGLLYRIEGFHLSYHDGELQKFKSFTQILGNAPESILTNIKQFYKVHQNYKPDLIISDFESFTYFFAKLHHIPLLSIDNMQVINRCSIDIAIPFLEKNSYLLAKNIIKFKVPYCENYLITSFFSVQIEKENTRIIPPIIRDEIIAAVPSVGSHILVYQTSSSQTDLIPVLQKVADHQFRVYGFNVDEEHGNVLLKSFSEKGFIDDLANAHAVVTNGGFSLISEAVFLHKPVCAVPIKDQFEQFVNAAYIEKLGYGRHFNSFTADFIKAFLYDTDRFRENVNSYLQDGNTETFNILDSILQT